MKVALSLGAAGCTGELKSTKYDSDGTTNAPGLPNAQGDQGTAETCEQVGIDVAPTVLRRLSNLEFSFTLADLFALPQAFDTARFPEDTYKGGFTSHADIQSVSAQHLRAYWEAAEVLAAELLDDSGRVPSLIGCEIDDEECLAEFVARFGRIAYRRPLTEDEVQDLVADAQQVAADDSDAYRFVIEALLLSPYFIYRVELGDSQDGISTLDAFELASRMSFTLWGRAPDEDLLDAAAAGQLDSDEGILEIAQRHLTDERTKQYYSAFFRQWLGYSQLGAPKDRPADWDDALIADLKAETDGVLQQFAFGEGDFLDVLTANTTYLTPALATYYGLPATDALNPYTFSDDHHRAHTGVLTHGSLLLQSRDGDLISMRGHWLRHTFLCQDMEIPASVAEELGERLVGLTRVQIVQERNVDPACRGCHSLLDPVGIGFEQFDGTGRFDESIDPSVFGLTPALTGADDAEFENLAQLARMLKEHPEVSGCLAQRAYLFIQGRAPQNQDACAVSTASAGFAKSGHDFGTLLESLILHPSFRLRRAPSL